MRKFVKKMLTLRKACVNINSVAAKAMKTNMKIKLKKCLTNDKAYDKLIKLLR